MEGACGFLWISKEGNHASGEITYGGACMPKLLGWSVRFRGVHDSVECTIPWGAISWSVRFRGARFRGVYDFMGRDSVGERFTGRVTLCENDVMYGHERCHAG